MISQEVKTILIIYFTAKWHFIKHTVDFVFTISSLDYKMNIHLHLIIISAFYIAKSQRQLIEIST